MQRREFTGCAAAFSLLACQKALGQSEREAAAEDGTTPRKPQAAGKLKLTHSTVDIALVCSDFKESLRFYHEQLGLEIVHDLQIPAAVAQGAGLAPRGFRQVRLRAGRTLIKLMEIASPPPRRTADFAAGVRWLTFFVDDLAKTVERLKADGVKFLAAPVAAPDAAGVACAVDPDGVLIELVQLKA
jgi:glyoxylase I family protein